MKVTRFLVAMRLNGKVPTVQASGEARVFGFFEEFGKDFIRQSPLVTDDEASAVREPCYDFGVLGAVQDGH
jgi:hypothetical protein